MNKLDVIVVTSVADNINKMSDIQLQILSDLLAKSKQGESLCNYISFGIQNKQEIELV